MIITVYLHSSKESMYDAGEKAGLKDDALHLFMYACTEVRVDLDVDEKGNAIIKSVDGRNLLVM